VIMIVFYVVIFFVMLSVFLEKQQKGYPQNSLSDSASLIISHE